jgi:hypothetical protein
MAKKLNQTAIAAAVKASAILVQLDKLSFDREKFEQGLQKRSNEKLYDICGLTYAKYCEANASSAVMKDTLLAMRTELEKRGMRIQKNTPALALFVRYVFNSDRQSTYVYTRALQYLFSENVKPEIAAQYISDKGGIDRCFKLRTPSAKQAQKQKQIEQAMPLVEETLSGSASQPIGKLKVPAFFVEKTCKEEFTFLIARSDPKGNVDVLSVVPKLSKAMLSIAKKELALFLSNQQQLATSKQQATRKSRSIEKAAEKAVTARQKKVASGTATVAEAIA